MSVELLIKGIYEDSELCKMIENSIHSGRYALEDSPKILAD
jgi:hypothetical protein